VDEVRRGRVRASQPPRRLGGCRRRGQARQASLTRRRRRAVLPVRPHLGQVSAYSASRLGRSSGRARRARTHGHERVLPPKERLDEHAGVPYPVRCGTHLVAADPGIARATGALVHPARAVHLRTPPDGCSMPARLASVVLRRLQKSLGPASPTGSALTTGKD